MRIMCAFSVVALACFMVATTGCDSQKSPPNPAVQSGHAGEHHHGPNGGELIELGSEEYHAELLQDTDESIVTIYLLDKEGKKAVPIAAETVLIRITLDNKPNEFPLAAKPKEGESAGNSSKFESNNKDLTLALGNDKAEREVEVKIGEKPYKQKFPYFVPHHPGHHEEDHKDEDKGKQPAP
jgi:hypothetical protein